MWRAILCYQALKVKVVFSANFKPRIKILQPFRSQKCQSNPKFHRRPFLIRILLALSKRKTLLKLKLNFRLRSRQPRIKGTQPREFKKRKILLKYQPLAKAISSNMQHQLSKALLTRIRLIQRKMLMTTSTQTSIMSTWTTTKKM
jgi:hypothetical protein